MSEPQEPIIIATGVDQFLSSDVLTARNQVLEELVQRAQSLRAHLWVATVMFKLSDRSLEQLSTEPLHMDAENLLYGGLGCYICEEVYTPRLLHRSCKGDPNERRRR